MQASTQRDREAFSDTLNATGHIKIDLAEGHYGGFLDEPILARQTVRCLGLPKSDDQSCFLNDY